jgi:hypothetical protein
MQLWFFGMTHKALYYGVKKSKAGKGEGISNDGTTYSLKHSSQQIFNHNKELMLTDHIIKWSKINAGMMYEQTYKLAYNYATKLCCKFPNSWAENRHAEADSLQGFMKLHTNHRLRKPENTSFLSSLHSIKQMSWTFFTTMNKLFSW